MPTRRLALVVVAFGLVVVACSGGDLAEEIIESQEGVGDVEIDEDSGEISVETDDGSVSIGGGELPDGFPIEVPDGGEVQTVLESGGETAVSLVYSSEFDEIEAFLENWIDSSGGEVTSKIESSSPNSVSWAVDDADTDAVYFIRLAEAGDGTVQVALNISA